ncbi:hypothetical protein E1B28_005142 [Marasmius oreades]|uniref:Uncharacterized protein n=1 Tax=Marasmius oreades TaxID=181124 RepID=A0A9P7UZZ5_9AGAR|nr:uncharacterized protein E1B28_005142 [Marasmius oreades]KAG7097824.1 hypothetical protein E1B28_005142 [Marasmius oreades]
MSSIFATFVESEGNETVVFANEVGVPCVAVETRWISLLRTHMRIILYLYHLEIPHICKLSVQYHPASSSRLNSFDTKTESIN